MYLKSTLWNLKSEKRLQGNLEIYNYETKKSSKQRMIKTTK